jgi:hypothetical protein
MQSRPWGGCLQYAHKAHISASCKRNFSHLLPTVFAINHFATPGGLHVLPHRCGHASIVCCVNMAYGLCQHSTKISRRTHVRNPYVTHVWSTTSSTWAQHTHWASSIEVAAVTPVGTTMRPSHTSASTTGTSQETYTHVQPQHFYTPTRITNSPQAAQGMCQLARLLRARQSSGSRQKHR